MTTGRSRVSAAFHDVHRRSIAAALVVWPEALADSGYVGWTALAWTAVHASPAGVSFHAS